MKTIVERKMTRQKQISKSVMRAENMIEAFFPKMKKNSNDDAERGSGKRAQKLMDNYLQYQD